MRNGSVVEGGSLVNDMPVRTICEGPRSLDAHAVGAIVDLGRFPSCALPN